LQRSCAVRIDAFRSCSKLYIIQYFTEITNGIAVIGGHTAGAFDRFLPARQVMLSCQALLQVRPRGNRSCSKRLACRWHDEGANEGNEPVPGKSCIVVLEELAVAANNILYRKRKKNRVLVSKSQLMCKAYPLAYPSS
jgi:hypothetical protein